MKIKKVRVHWAPVVAQDLAGYNLYVGKGAIPTYDSIKLQLLPSTIEVVLPDLDPSVFVGETLFYVGLSSYDTTGNESDIAQAPYPFDFTPPPMPTDVGWSAL